MKAVKIIVTRDFPTITTCSKNKAHGLINYGSLCKGIGGDQRGNAKRGAFMKVNLEKFG